MKFLLIRSALAVLLSLAALSVYSAAPVISQAARENLQRRVEYGHLTGVAVGMVNRDGRTFFNAGVRRAGTDTPVQANTIFEIGSITKGFTGTLLAEMILRGEIALTNTAQSYLPAEVNVPRGAREISLLHLATHRSGLPDNPSNLCSPGLQGIFDCFSVQRVYDFLNSYTLPGEPNTAWTYSNVGFGLLGHILSLKAGVGYEDLLRERLLEPLGLKDTRITLSSEQRARRATAHWGIVPWGEFTMPALEGAGGLLSTTEDLLTLIEHLTGLKTNLAAVATEALRRRAETGNPSIGMALGWLLIRLPNGEVVQHDGSSYGQNAFIGFNRSTRQGVVVLCNNRASAYGSVQDIGFHLLDSNIPLQVPPRPAAVTPAQLASYEGRYQAEGGLTFDVRLFLNRLTLDFAPDHSPGFAVHPESPTRFGAYEVTINGRAEFNLDGARATLTWTQNGASAFFTRIALSPRLSISSAGTLTLTGTPGFEYDLHSSSDLFAWTRQGAIRMEDVPLPAKNVAASKGFFRATFPPLE